MSGNTDNENILAGVNQVIKAINDLVLNLKCSPVVNVTVSGGGCGNNCISGGGPFIQPDPAEGQPAPGQPDPENPPSGYNPPSGGPAYDAYKCRAAKFLTDAYITYVNHFLTIGGVLSVLGPSAIFAPMPEAFMALISPALAFALFAYLIVISVGFAALASVFAVYKSNLEDSQDEAICNIYSAQTPSEVRTAILNWMTDASPVGLPSDWVSYHIDNLFPQSVLNIPFVYYAPLAGLPDYNCLENCAEGYVWPFDESAEGWEWESLSGVNPVDGQWLFYLGDGILVSTIQPTDGNPCSQQWSISDIPFNVKGTLLTVSCYFDANTTLDMLVRYEDNSTTTETIGASGTGEGDKTMVLDGSKLIKDIELALSKDPGGATSFNYSVFFRSVSVS